MAQPSVFTENSFKFSDQNDMRNRYGDAPSGMPAHGEHVVSCLK
jgi:hypothetical protein